MAKADKDFAQSMMTAMGRVRMAAESLKDAVPLAPVEPDYGVADYAAEHSPPAPSSDPSDPEEGMADILASIRRLISEGGDEIIPTEWTADPEVRAIRRVAAGIADRHLAAFVTACRCEAIQPPSCDVLALLLCLLPDERCQTLASAFPDEVEVSIDRVFELNGILIADLVELRTALSAFRDSTVFRPMPP